MLIIREKRELREVKWKTENIRIVAESKVIADADDNEKVDIQTTFLKYQKNQIQ